MSRVRLIVFLTTLCRLVCGLGLELGRVVTAARGGPEVVDCPERLDRVLPQVDPMMQGGLITMERVRVLKYEEPKRGN